MDENKKQVLKDIGYRVRQTCLCCKYSFITGNWGTCHLYTYDHLKHNEKSRYLSVHASGYCARFVMKESFSFGIHGFQEFMEK
jgi:hypothetical protein